MPHSRRAARVRAGLGDGGCRSRDHRTSLGRPRGVTPRDERHLPGRDWLRLRACGGRSADGYSAGIDLDDLASFVGAARHVAPTTPVLTGIGISTPELEASVVQQCGVTGVVILGQPGPWLTQTAGDRCTP